MLLAAGLAYLAYLLRVVLVPFVLAIVFAFILEPPIHFLEQRRVPRLAAILAVYAVAALLLATLLFWLIPVLIRQLTVLAATLPGFAAQIQGILVDIQARYTAAGLPPQVRQVLDGAIGRAEADLLILIQNVLSGLFGAVSGLLTLLLAPFLAFYLLRDRESIRAWVLSLLPVSTRGDSLRAIAEVNHVVAGFIRGQLLVAAVVGLLVGLATYLLGLPFSAILGVIAGVTNIIPYFGPIIGGVPAVALALLRSPLLAVETVLALFLVQQADNLFITPRLVGGSVGLHPLLVIFSLLAGAELFGVVGMLVAVPVVAVGKIFLKHLFEKLVTDWTR